MASIQKAGAIVLSKENPRSVALLFRSQQNDWSFPKGHIEINETPIEAAIREVMEETGLTVRFIKELPAFHYLQNSDTKIEVKMFLAQSNDDRQLKNEFAGDKIIWVDYLDVSQKLSYANIREYYSQIMKSIESEIKVIISV